MTRWLRDSGLIPLLVIVLLSGCTNVRMRVPTPEEKRHYIFSKNLDPAIVDANERGPLNLVHVLASDGSQTPDSAVDYVRMQKNLLSSDIKLADYEDEQSEDMPALTSGEKGTSVIIATVIVVGVLIGITIPVLYLLNIL